MKLAALQDACTETNVLAVVCSSRNRRHGCRRGTPGGVRYKAFGYCLNFPGCSPEHMLMVTSPFNSLRSISGLFVGAALVMIPGGVLYSLLSLAFGFNQQSHSRGTITLRIAICLLCGALAGFVTQRISREALPLSVTFLAFACLIAGLLNFDTSGLYHDATTIGRAILALALAVIVYGAGRAATAMPTSA